MEETDQLFGVDFQGLSTEDDLDYFDETGETRHGLAPEILRPVSIYNSNSDSGLFKDLKPSTDNNHQDWKQNLMLRSLSSEYIQRYSSFGDSERVFSLDSTDSYQNYNIRTPPKTANRVSNNLPLPAISPQSGGSTGLVISEYGSDGGKFGRPLTPMDIKVDLWPAHETASLTSASTTSHHSPSPQTKKISQNSLLESADVSIMQESQENEEKSADEDRSPPQTPQHETVKTPSSATPDRGLMTYDELISGLDSEFAHHLHRIESIHRDHRLAIRHARAEHYQHLLAQLQPAKTAFTTYRQVLTQWETATARIENVAGGLCIIVILPYLRLVRVEVRPVLTVQEKLQRAAMEIWQVGSGYWQASWKLASSQLAVTDKGKAVAPAGSAWSSWASSLFATIGTTTEGAKKVEDTQDTNKDNHDNCQTHNKHSPQYTTIDIDHDKPPIIPKRRHNKKRNENSYDSDCDSMAGNVDNDKKPVQQLRKSTGKKKLSLSFIPTIPDDNKISDNNHNLSPQISPSVLQNPHKKKGFHSPKVISDSPIPSPKIRVGLQESFYFSQHDMSSSMMSKASAVSVGDKSPSPENEKQQQSESSLPEKKQQLSAHNDGGSSNNFPITGTRRRNGSTSKPRSISYSSPQQQLSTPDKFQRLPSELLLSLSSMGTTPEEAKAEDEYLDLDNYRQEKQSKRRLGKKKSSRNRQHLPPLSPKPIFTTSSSGRVSVRIEAYRTNRKYDPYANFENTQYFGDFEIQLDPSTTGSVNAVISNESLAHRYNKQTGLLVVYVNQVQLSPDSEHLKTSTSTTAAAAAVEEARENPPRTASFGSVFSASSFYASRSNANSSPSSPRANRAGLKLQPLMPWNQSTESFYNNNNHQSGSNDGNNSNSSSHNSETSSKDDDNNRNHGGSNKSRARHALESSSSPEAAAAASPPTPKHLPHSTAALVRSKEVFEI